MNITHEKYKADLSRFYRLGYATCFESIMRVVKEFKEGLPKDKEKAIVEAMIKRLGNYYMSYPNVPKIEEFSNE